MKYGPRYNWQLNSTVSTCLSITIFPKWDGFKEEQIIEKSTYRTYGGKLHSYTMTGCWWRFTLPIQVACYDVAMIVNSWWESQTNLWLGINVGSLSPIYEPWSLQVFISNEMEPFARRLPYNYDKYQGVILLENT